MVEELMRVIVPCVNGFYNIRILVFYFQLGFSNEKFIKKHNCQI